MEPYKLRRWRRGGSPDKVRFYTCARPGRSHGSDKAVADRVVKSWLAMLPGPPTAIVSLLGRKPDGTSEFCFYTFRGQHDNDVRAGGKPLFADWLAKHCPGSDIVVSEHPTTDFEKIEHHALEHISAQIERLLAQGRTVVLIDSGGETRARAVAKHLHMVEDSRT